MFIQLARFSGWCIFLDCWTSFSGQFGASPVHPQLGWKSFNDSDNMGRRRRKKKNGSSAVSGKSLPGDKPGTLTKQMAFVFPDRFLCKMVAAQVISVADPDTYTDVIVSGNSVFDPLAALGSAQPPWFDVLATVYAKYVSVRSRASFSVMFSGNGSLPCVTYRCVVVPRNISTAYSTMSDAKANPRAVWRDVNLPGAQMKLTSPWISGTTIFGTQNALQTSSNALTQTALISANPSAEWFWHIAAVTPSPGTSIAVELDLLLEYEVEFFDRNARGLDFAAEMQKRVNDRKEYLRLKELTPDKSGRVPPEQPEDLLRKYVSSLAEKKAESKEPSRWVLTKTPSSVKL